MTRSQERAAELGLHAPIVGHVGDGNFHNTIFLNKGNADEMAKCEGYVKWLADMALELEGTITGEHGVGQGKIASLARELGPSVNVMAAIKRALDPDNIMNPGKIIALD